MLFIFNRYLNFNSIILIENLLETIEKDKNNFPYLKTIIIQNKINFQKDKQIQNIEINKYLNNIKNLVNYEICYDYIINELLNKIIDAIYNNSVNKFILPTNIISETFEHKLYNMIPYKVLTFILMGETCVGKTAFLDRYFKYDYKKIFLGKIGINKGIKYVKIYDNIYKVTVLDTTGQEKFKGLTRKYYQNADSIFLLFDLTNEHTFYNISSFIKDIKDNYSNERVPIIYLIGNKVDLTNIVI